MLLNFSRLGMKNEAKELSNSLNGYLNLHRATMISSLKSLDFFNNTEQAEKCGEDECLI